ncbi:MAG: hypothetical protein LAO21_10030 [Acidobacteriia bacterium]|nr:hypothetical protein [Terriglobia bacterium]
MSDRTTIRNFWMVFIACLALVVIVMAIVSASLQIGTVEETSPGGVRATIPAHTPLEPATKSIPWHERATGWLIWFVLTVILSGRFILLLGVLLFYGFIIAYIAPNAWQRIKARLWGKAADVAPQKAVVPRKQK